MLYLQHKSAIQFICTYYTFFFLYRQLTLCVLSGQNEDVSLDMGTSLRYNENNFTEKMEMAHLRRKIFGIIAAQAADMEQREILYGVMEQAQLMNIDIVILSNIYNPNEPNAALRCENAIYDLILSHAFDGFILISEVIINTELQQQIIQNLTRQQNLPIVAIGTPLPDFVLPNFQFINTNDVHDMEDITNHLIEVHGFTNIDMLTGHSFIQASHLRVEGYRNALTTHGIPFHENKVHFGDFWMNSGQELAMQYIQKELPLPEAILCANDHMAYGLLDTFLDNGINVPHDVTVVGYEYIRERFSHAPILTTYQRNRKGLGTAAVRFLSEKLASGSYPEIPELTGKMIHGNSCSCSIAPEHLNAELKEIHAKEVHSFLNLFSQFDRCLAECSNIYDLLHVCRDFRYLLQHVDEMYLCLYDSWYESAANADTMVCYSIFSDRQTLSLHQSEFAKLFDDEPAAYYLNPLFFSRKTLGYVILKCSTPDAYDNTFRNWLKSVANGLEVLHMKNDIQYLTKCQNLSGQRDSLTNLYNAKGMESVYRSLKRTGNTDFTYVLLKICIFENAFPNVDQKISAILDAAEAVKEFCGSKDICERISDTVFACFVYGKGSNTELLADRLSSIFLQRKDYIKNYGMDSYLCLAVQCDQDSTRSKLLAFSTSHLDAKLKLLSENRSLPYYQEMLQIRNTIYIAPEKTVSMESICQAHAFSCGHLRVLYKNCFGISIHQDCIRARIAKAKYLLCTTDQNVRHIAEQCGYQDEKYFLRQFSKITGYTPKQYRYLK